MDRVSGKLTIYFEDPFWVGVFERIYNKNRISRNGKSFHIFRNVGNESISKDELNDIQSAYSEFTPLNPGKRGIMPADKVLFYNRIDIGIFICFMDICLEHCNIAFEKNYILMMTKKADTMIRRNAGNQFFPSGI